MSNCPGGYNCRVALVNLNKLRIEAVDLDPEALEYFPGGRALGVALLYNLLGRYDSPLVLATSPLVGSGFVMANRLTIVFKSPLTGTIAWANTGGYVSPALKKAGFDALVIVGRSREPHYLLIEDGSVDLLPAEDLWGLDAVEVALMLRRRHGDVRVLSIGPAGERGVSYATVINDTGRSSGVRHGAGAVMGLKRLKAIALKAKGVGSKAKPSDRSTLLRISREIASRIMASSLLNREKGLLAVYGTPVAMEALGPAEAVPHLNYRNPVLERWEALSGRIMSKTILAGRLTCSSCPVACRRDTVGVSLSFRTEGPDYAQISSLGSNTGLISLEGVGYLTSLSYRLGLDPIEAGNILAMYAEITELEDLGREGLVWGDLEAMEKLLVSTAYRRGVGDLLAGGARVVAEKLKRPEVRTDVKGVTIQNADPRVEKAWGVINSVEAFGGAAHIWVYGGIVASFKTLGVNVAVDWSFNPETTAKAVYEHQLLVAAADTLQVCAFSQYAAGWRDYARALSAVTGVKWSVEKLRGAAETLLDLERLLNQQLGIEPTEDVLPPKFTENPVPKGKHKGETADVSSHIEEYYSLRNLKNGKIGSERMREATSKAKAARIA
ncbi:tungsten-containing aldehyde ferredoxin oxidoreductase [Aeropyrum pernix K1]|uniref:Tungsten-containing aldehyde ferredoxin oxidoreductase n=1 Tax=Aeropyrum pernix (strain ATCC 700893 / DSM 11879 / JCM 9820 / NBRC 100138 / K1) TaxID=272557 RepID=Q9YFI0_AERPE|nr:tungsten-containing aldehyde ferredoxin oxidoreductase [Aeropyrum pernix K1]